MTKSEQIMCAKKMQTSRFAMIEPVVGGNKLKYGLDGKPLRVTNAQYGFIIKQYLAGTPINSIAEMTEIDRNYIRGIIRRVGLRRKDNGCG